MNEVAHPELERLQAWFASYCRSFRTDDLEVQRNYDLKEEHTRKVCEAARLIAADGTERSRLLAEVAALCHDLGRFPQYREYHTFKDSDSVNHAHLSVQVMAENALLDFLPADERSCVELAVRFHNVFQIPAALPTETERLLKLLRDADKLDIWRVFIDYFQAPEQERASAAALGFPDLPECSPETLASVTAGKMVQLSTLKTLNDFKLLQLSWIYDINFPTTLRLVRERRILDRFAVILPEDEAVRDALATVRGYLDRRIAEAELPHPAPTRPASS